MAITFAAQSWLAGRERLKTIGCTAPVLSLLLLAMANTAYATAKPLVRTGVASFYGAKFAGKTMANGNKFDPNAMTAASLQLPLGSRVRVTNLRNQRQIVVRITDRGPFAKNRIIDLSRHAAEKLRMIEAGTAKVRVRLLPR